jgi:hypothetical protein
LKVGDRTRVSRDLLDETNTRKEGKAMNKNLMRPVIRLCAVIVLLGWASWATAGPKPPSPPPSHDHAVEVTVANNAGDSILGDGVVYTDGVGGTGARIWDFDPPAADHLHFQVEKKFAERFLKLVIGEQPGLPPGGVDAVCQVGRLKPNESPIGFQFYNDPDFPVGDSTSGPENYGGTFKCTTDNRGKTGWFVHWDPADECIVISHPADFTYAFTAVAGCLADVSQIVNGAVQPPLGAYDVPFQVIATELP